MRIGFGRVLGSHWPFSSTTSIRACTRSSHHLRPGQVRAHHHYGAHPNSRPQCAAFQLYTQRAFNSSARDGSTRSAENSFLNALREGETDIGQTSDKKEHNHKPNINRLTPNIRLRPKLAETKNADAWMLLLDQFLPQNLRFFHPGEYHSPQDSQRSSEYILKILNKARTQANAGVDLLAHMGVQHSRWKAVVWIADQLLKNVTTEATARTASRVPSNIEWPKSSSLEEMCRGPIVIDNMLYRNQQQRDEWGQTPLDNRYSHPTSPGKSATMTQIWYSLGSIIIESADMAKDQAREALQAVYRIIGQLHNSDLVPDFVYSYNPTHLNCCVQRPPIMHLLSSRILSTLSDAVWRSHSDEVIEQAASQGAQYKDLGLDPPGGRFRLKVQALGPEVWLEFVLWCCVDGGFSVIGSRLIDHLRAKTKSPWFAVGWLQPRGGNHNHGNIDWQRVKLRHGGSVGQIEGYSTERPFVEMEPRTISLEVVMSLVEGLIDKQGSRFSKLQSHIKNLVSFLEPHSLPPQYFDYLAVRACQSFDFDADRQPNNLATWNQTMTYLRSLERATPALDATPSLDFSTILMHSELRSGLLQQSMEMFVHIGDMRNAIEAFTAVQQGVDSSKLQSIGDFLEQELATVETTKPPPIDPSRIDFVRSHGQLPNYKLSGLLHLITDSKLVRLGHWLVYNEDVDGPLIPTSAYAQSCLGPQLVRFAALSNDDLLVRQLEAARRRSHLKPSVNFLRSLVNAYICFHRFKKAETVLQELVPAEAGGYSPSNLAFLGSAILRLEDGNSEPMHKIVPGANQTNAELKMNYAIGLAHKVLNGDYDAREGDFRVEQRALFRRQVSSILRIFSNVDSRKLNELAEQWERFYTTSNDVNLPASTFNTLLATIVDLKGSAEGQRLWDLFCQDPRVRVLDGRFVEPEDSFVIQNAGADEELWDGLDRQQQKLERSEPSDPHIPFVTNWEPTKELDSSNIEIEIGEVEFMQPFQLENIAVLAPSFSASSESNETLLPFQFSISERDPGRDSASDTFNPLVAPDLRTLRIIVRAALSEKRNLASRKASTSNQQSILEWSQQFYRAFGASKDTIEQELQQEYVRGENDDLSLVEAMAKYDDTRRKSGLMEKSKLDIGASFRKSAPITKISSGSPVRMLLAKDPKVYEKNIRVREVYSQHNEPEMMSVKVARSVSKQDYDEGVIVGEANRRGRGTESKEKN